MMMYMPSVFGDNFVDALTDSSFDSLARAFFSEPVRSRQMSGLMRTNVEERDDGYAMTVELPGYKKDDIRLELQDGYLVISAQKQESQEEKDKAGKLIRRERYQGSAQRSFYVGDGLREEDIKARFENGVLSLTFPKEAPQQVPEKKQILIEG